MTKLYVRTAIFGGYDRLQPVPEEFRCDDISWICYTDRPVDSPDSGWLDWTPSFSELEAPDRFLESTDKLQWFRAKVAKVIPWHIDPSHPLGLEDGSPNTLSLWVDGSHVPNLNPLELASAYLGENEMAFYRHPEGRRDVYDEARVCIFNNLDDWRVMLKQVERYRKAGYPAGRGIDTCTVFFHRNTTAVRGFLEMWWREIFGGSFRDQISFDYVKWLAEWDERIATISGSPYDGEFFRYRRHQRGTPPDLSQLKLDDVMEKIEAERKRLLGLKE